MDQQVVLKAVPGGVEKKRFSEEELKILAKEDRERAFHCVVQQYKRPLYYHALYMLRDEDEALDVSQEVLIRAYQENRLFDDDFAIKAWLYRVATNLCHNLRRSSRRKQKACDVLMREEEPRIEGTDEVIIGEEEREKLLDALEQLPEKDKNILLLRYFDNLSYKEISTALKCKLGTVMSRLGRARNRLAKSVDHAL
ncbi:MAG TPA: RNA polymerase sigma factor [Bdellovibrionota bacterium]|nr:RNA polymerase sigma factor [Bdellovibrionota bacterium]